MVKFFDTCDWHQNHQPNNPVLHNSHTERFREIHEKGQLIAASLNAANDDHPIHFYLLSERSDGFKPRYSTKANQGSA